MVLDASVARQLSGATMALASNKKMVNACAFALLTCVEHSGAHHFAIIGEGQTLVMSKAALKCLQDMGVGIENMEQVDGAEKTED